MQPTLGFVCGIAASAPGSVRAPVRCAHATTVLGAGPLRTPPARAQLTRSCWSRPHPEHPLVGTQRDSFGAKSRPCTSASRIGSQPRAAAEPAAGQDVKGLAEKRMQKTIDSTAASFSTVRTGRASASILDRIVVDYYGAETPLNALASISVQGSSTLLISPFDKSGMKDIERAIMESDLGMTPSNDGSVIRLSVPPLTQERRKELVKQVKTLAEDGRVAIRNIRRDAVDKCKKIEKDGDMGKDESKDVQDSIQKATDKFIKKIDAMLKDKEKDIMTV